MFFLIRTEGERLKEVHSDHSEPGDAQQEVKLTTVVKLVKT